LQEVAPFEQKGVALFDHFYAFGDDELAEVVTEVNHRTDDTELLGVGVNAPYQRKVELDELRL